MHLAACPDNILFKLQKIMIKMAHSMRFDLACRLAQRFPVLHVLGEVARDGQHRVHPIRGRPQRRIGDRQVTPAEALGVDPGGVADVFSGEAPVQRGFDSLLEAARPDDLRHVHPDRTSDGHSPVPRGDRVEALTSVIPSDDPDAVR